MPIYEYACPDCGHAFEQSQKFTDPPLKRCPNCGRRKVYRIVSKVAVTFKGSGFYITDSKSSDSAKHSAKKPKPAEDKPVEAPAATESKPAETPATPPAETKTDSSGPAKTDKK